MIDTSPKPPPYAELRKINVGEHVEKKNNLSYLSWAWAVDQLLLQDPAATWEYAEPRMFGDTMMVFCTVKAFGKPMTAQLPVMNHRNQAIQLPNAFEVNTAMQRCLAKAIALHGIGLYIYAGEDLPPSDDESSDPPQQGTPSADPPPPQTVDVRKANALAAKIIASAGPGGSDSKLLDLVREGKSGGPDFWTCVWAGIPSPIRQHIYKVCPKEA